MDKSTKLALNLTGLIVGTAALGLQRDIFGFILAIVGIALNAKLLFVNLGITNHD